MTIATVPTRGGLIRFAGLWLAVALGGLFCFLAASEVLLRRYVEPNDLLYRHMRFLAEATSADVVFGDSHAALGFTGRPPFVNLAYPGEDPLTIESKVRHYFVRRTPRRVVLQADPNQLSERRNRAQERDYLRPEALGGPLRVLAERHRSQLLAYWRVALSGEGFHSNRDFRADGAETMAGDFARRSPAERRSEAAQTVAEQRPDFDGAAGRALDVLARTAGFIQARGGRVCLVTFPVSAEYRAASARHAGFARALDALDGLAARLGAGRLSLWDAFGDDGRFANADHLNAAAAEAAAARIVAGCGFDGTGRAGGE